jgi:dTDP-4-amino-4,6-dideoxygalactose transaminase
MPDVSAAIGLAQLERAELLRQARERCARYYLEKLRGIDCIDLPCLHVAMSDHAWHIFHIILKDDHTVSRNQFFEKKRTRDRSSSTTSRCIA